MMTRKIISFITLVFFLGYTLSCVSRTYQRTEVEKIPSYQQGKQVLLLRVEKKSGELIEFSKDRPGRLVGDKIIGPSDTRIQTDIKTADIEKTYRKRGQPSQIITKDGKSYDVLKVIVETKDHLVIETSGPGGMVIPLSDVKFAWVLRTNHFLTALGIVLPIAVILAVFATGLNFPALDFSGLSTSSGGAGSCLFIYSFDGEEFIFDAEPYGGAICRGLKRSEWCILENLKEHDGQYHLLIRNELDETQYTDELRLVVVDHPAGIKIAPDESGRIHTLGDLQAPERAFDSEAKDISQAVSDHDHVLWQKTYRSMNRLKKEGLREELTFEFPKPQNARIAKLFVHAGTDLWGAQVAKTFLHLYGSNLPQWYDDVNRLGPEFYRVWSWFAEEELYLLNIRVQTPSGWKTKGTIFGGGPFISEDKAYLIDISDVPGETLRIKLTPPVNFWKLDRVAVDYTEDLPLHITEVAPFRAVSSRGEDVRVALSSLDNDFFVMPELEEFAELSYNSPPQLPNTERTVILKATGYYDVHLNPHGKKRTEVLERIETQPGYTLQFAYQTYLKASAEKKR